MTNTSFSVSASKTLRKIFSRQMLSALALVALLASCKKESSDDNGGNNGGNNNGGNTNTEGYFPAKTNTVWSYSTQDPDGDSEHSLSVVATKDSAGGKVIKYESAFSDGTKIFPYVHSTSSQTTYAHTLPSSITDLLVYLEEQPEIHDVTLTGVPMFQKMAHSPKANDPVTFSEPLQLSWKATVEGETYDFLMSFAFTEGKVVGFEDVTTPAGTYKNALKWQYKATLSTEGPGGAESEEFTHTAWYAKGVGLVKSVEVGAEGTSTTVLKSVTNK